MRNVPNITKARVACVAAVIDICSSDACSLKILKLELGGEGRGALPQAAMRYYAQPCSKEIDCAAKHSWAGRLARLPTDDALACKCSGS